MGFTKKEMEEQGFSAEQMAWAMKERGIEKETDKSEMEKLKTTLADKEKELSETNEKIKAFDGTDVKLKELTDKVADYEKTETERQQAELQAKTDAEFTDRFNKARGDRNIKHPLIEKGRLEEFKAAFTDEQFKGKSDAEILEAIVKPEDWENKQQATITMPGGRVETGNLDGVEKAFMARNPNIKF